ncbi:unnamed protein product [Periconia digitata]|uniref:Zn(2)-C6 fungal-type domain-containing protein n=1 Tax=Periconia digitata TaxID=1303443 RepID=A0A9W4XN94_9PLEO|nr:unnamed protein product [Periconia digitata]
MPEVARSHRRIQPASRSGRPCDPCRRRKTRCVVEPGHVKCRLCLHRQNNCTFDKAPPKRSVPGGTELNESGSIAQESPSPQEVLTSDLEEGRDLNPTLAPASAEHNHQAKTSIQSSEFDAALGLNRTKFAELYGLGSDMEPILMRHRPYNATTNEYTLPTHAIRLVSARDQGVDYPVTFHMVSDQKRNVPSPDRTRDIDAIEAYVEPHGDKLVRLFWKMVHPTYPIIHKQNFINMYSESYRQIDAPLLGAVYLIATNWWHYDPNLSNQPIPNVVGLRKLVIKTIQESYHRPRLSSIEAILLYLQCKPEDPLNPDHTFAWGLTAQALAVGEASGLHLDASGWAIPDWERSLRKRLSWALYTQDVWTALAHGRPTHISINNWAVTDLTPEDFEAKSSLDEGVSFINTTNLAKILYRVLDEFYSLRASTLQDTAQLFSMARPIWSALESWYADLPSSLRMDSLPLRQLCPNGNVHFAYYAVKVSTLRRLVRSTALAPLCIDVDLLHSIRQQAHATAQQAITLVATLRLEHLDAFWFFAAPYYFSVIGSFCVLLLVTSLTPAERDHWRESLRSYLWILRVGCKSNGPMRYAVDRLEGAILRGLEHALVVTVDITSPSAPEATPNQYDANIDGFGFALSGAETLDFSMIDLDAFDFLSGSTIS